MRILCLHGKGTNSEILEMQTENFRQLLPVHYDFQFFDGEFEGPPAPGVDRVFPGPYRRYLLDNSVESTAEQHEFIKEIMEDEGPFDGIMGFSQGASLAASLLLHHQMEHPFAPPLFRFAIFICSTYPHSCSASIGKDVTELVKPDEQPRSRRSMDSGYESEADAARCRVRLLCVEVEKTKISIPTAHIYGAEDKLMHESVEVEEMCDKRFAFSYKHKGGHEVPMDAITSKAIRDTIVSAIERCDIFS